MKLRNIVAAVGIATLVACGSGTVDSTDSDLQPDEVSTNPFSLGDALATPDEGEDPPKGEIGFILDLRHFAKLGHRPVLVELTALEADFDMLFNSNIDVELGNGTFMGKYSIPLKTFEDAEYAGLLDRLESGIDFSVRIFGADSIDSNGNKTAAPLFDNSEVDPLRSVIFSSSADPIIVTVPDLPDLNTELVLRPDAYYYIEQVDLAGNPLGKGMYYDGNNNRYISKDNIPLNAVPGDAETNKFLFRFFKWGEDRYAIQNVHTGKFVQDWDYHYDSSKDPHSVLIGGGLWTLDAIRRSNWTGTYVFRFEKTASGSYEMITHRAPVRMAGNRLISSTYWPGNPTPAVATRWRVVSTNIEWQVQTLKSDVLEPIVGPPEIGIAYDAVEINCGNANLEVETGIERSATTTLSAEWQESLSTLSSTSHSLGWELSVEFGGPFGANYGGKLSGEHTWKTENSRTVTETSGTETSETVAYSSVKSVTIPGGSAVRVKATFETYDDVQVTFAQRLLMRGVDKTSGLYLTGQEIKSQLLSTGFNGVIDEPEEGDDHVVVSLRSVANVSNLVKGYNTVRPYDEFDCNAQDESL